MQRPRSPRNGVGWGVGVGTEKPLAGLAPYVWFLMTPKPMRDENLKNTKFILKYPARPPGTAWGGMYGHGSACHGTVWHGMAR